MRTSVVIDLLYGDTGKGRTVSSLCIGESKPVVVRFNGGHQAGHNVQADGKEHIFANFGSGTLQGVPTIWLPPCTFYPTSFLNELDTLSPLEPEFYLHPLCILTTPLDVKMNTSDDENLKHGSCGSGFGATLQRQEDHFRIHALHLFHPKILRAKLEAAAEHYFLPRGVTVADHVLEEYYESCAKVAKLVKLHMGTISSEYSHIIYEGAQGTMLDQDFGIFPNVTRSNTTSLNIWKTADLSREITLYYTTRAYQTRHGTGWISDERMLPLKNAEGETNLYNQYQKRFRAGFLDLDVLRYSIDCNRLSGLIGKEVLVISHLDQVESPLRVIYNDKEVRMQPEDIAKTLGVDAYSLVASAESQEMVILNAAQEAAFA